jgi:uncharacterized protein (TIGR02391 family)
MVQKFDDLALRNISEILAEQWTHSIITKEFASASIAEIGGSNKSDRVFNALKVKQQRDNCGNNVLALVVGLLNPKRHSDEDGFEKLRARVNEKLIFEGIEISKEGKAQAVKKAATLSEAKERSQKIKQKIHGMMIHHEIIPYCEAEWLRENYFHAILEIAKSVAEKLRQISGLTSDGAELVDTCFALGKDNRPMLAFNTLATDSQQSEHKGFSNFLKGFFSMYRNPKAHNVKILEDTQITEMSEVLIVATIIHRRLDHTHRTGFR